MTIPSKRMPVITDYGNPQAVSPNEILFLSDENGIYNRNLARLDSSISKIDTIIHYGYYARLSHLTDNYYSILEQAYNPASGQCGDILLYDKVKRIYLTPLDNSPRKDAPSASAIQAEIQKAQQIKDSINHKKAEHVPLVIIIQVPKMFRNWKSHTMKIALIIPTAIWSVDKAVFYFRCSLRTASSNPR